MTELHREVATDKTKTYIHFGDSAIAKNYGNNLVSTGMATKCAIKKAKRFKSGFELEITGLTPENLAKLVFEFESQDWFEERLWNQEFDDTSWLAA
jgi:hypothetical protein